MQFPVLIEPVVNNGFRARSGAPLELSAEGATRDEAIHNFQAQLRLRLQAGAEIATVEIASAAVENPWVKYAGMFKDNPDFQEVIDIIDDNRRKMNVDPDVP